MDNFFARVEARRHAWPAHRRDLHWHVLPDTATAQQLSQPYQEVTSTPGLHAVPPQWLHLTVLHAGPQTDATEPELEAIVGKVRAAASEIDPFDIILDRPSVGNVALECPGRPGAPARRLWELTARATAEVVSDRWSLLPGQYYPHVSVAYAGPDAHLADRTALKVALSDIDAEPVTLRATALSLVTQWHDGKSAIRWEHLLDVPLGR